MSDVIEIHPVERDPCAKCGEDEIFGPPLLIKAEGKYYGIKLCIGCALEHAGNVSERHLDAIDALCNKIQG